MDENDVKQDFSKSVRVAKYTVISSVAGALLTAAYESTRANHKAQPNTSAPKSTLRTRPIRLLTASAALNSGIVGFAFFSLREYIVSPLLESPAISPSSSTKDSSTTSRPLTWSDMRMHHVLDTALSSTLLGGAFNAWKRGPAGALPGAFTAGIACTLLQFVVNEAEVARVKYVSSRLEGESSPLRSPEKQNSSADTQKEGFSNSPSAASPVSSYILSSRLLRLLGLKKMTDDEYLAVLKKERDGHLKRIEELEAQLSGQGPPSDKSDNEQR